MGHGFQFGNCRKRKKNTNGLQVTVPRPRRGSNVDDSLFPLESLFRISRITRTVRPATQATQETQATQVLDEGRIWRIAPRNLWKPFQVNI